jgi:hypothetical protein
VVSFFSTNFRAAKKVGLLHQAQSRNDCSGSQAAIELLHPPRINAPLTA